MKNVLLSITLALVAFTVQATNTLPDPKPTVPNQQQSQHQSQSQKATSRSNSSAKASARSRSSSRSNASNGDQMTDVNVVNEGDTAPRQLAIPPDVVLPSIYPSASCYYGGSAGVSFGNGNFGAGIGGGKAKLDKECDLRETARAFASIGQNAVAFNLLCKSARVVDTIGEEDCIKLLEDHPASTPVVSMVAEPSPNPLPSNLVTQEELNKKLDAIVKLLSQK